MRIPYIDVVRFLLEKRGRSERAQSGGETALHWRRSVRTRTSRGCCSARRGGGCERKPNKGHRWTGR